MIQADTTAGHPVPDAAGRPALLHRPALLWPLVAVALLAVYPPEAVRDALLHLRVPDTDDAMRLVGVRDLVAGQGWFDNAQHRFLPPEGVASHWSRLVDAPLAALQLALIPLVGRPLAEGLSAVLWPAGLFVVYGGLLIGALRPRFGLPAALLALLVAAGSWPVAVQFAPGRVDHHNVQLLLVLGIGLCLMRDGARAGAGAGALAALSLAVGLETLPFLAVAALVLVGGWVREGAARLPALAGFGVALGLGAPGLFALQTAPVLWSAAACDALSPPWLWWCGAGALAVAACAALSPRLPGRAARGALVLALGAALAAGFAALFPACLAGPFAGLPESLRRDWLHGVTEMQPLWTLARGGRWDLSAAAWPAMLAAALAASAMAIRSPEHRRFYGIAALFLWPGVLMGLVQLRGVYPAAGLLPLVAGPVTAAALDRLLDADGGWRRRLPGLALAAALNGSVWTALAACLAPAPSASHAPAEGRPRAERGSSRDCAAPEAVAPLAALPPGTVFAPVDVGPAILLHTPHAVVAAPYHRAVRGLLAALEGLGGSEADLRRQVAATGATYLALCPGDAAPAAGPLPFAFLLLRGGPSPSWLEPLPMPPPMRAGALPVWRVRATD